MLELFSDLRHWQQIVQRELQPERLTPTLTAGLISGALNVIYAISVPALVFSGSLAPFIPVGIGIGLFTHMVLGVLISLTTSLPGSVIMVQDTPAIIVALAVGAIATQLSAASSETQLATVLVTIALTTLLTGITFFLLGRFRLGHLTRFMPYPVVGGFLAGVGYLLTQGAFVLMTDRFFGASELSTLLQPDMLLRWVPGVGIAVLLLLLLRRYNNALIIPSVILGAIALFYLGLWLTGTSIEAARVAGLLLNPFPGNGLWQPIRPATLAQVQWPLVLGQLDQIGTAVLLSVVGMLLNNSGIELAARRDVDLNRELQVTGIANLIAGLGGGLVGFISLGLSTLSCVKIGANSRFVGLIMAAICGITLIGGEGVVLLVPKPILGGVALFLGLGFLVEWLFDAWFKLPRLDYGLVLIILGVIITVGFLQGVAVGLLLAIALFALSYSRIRISRHVLSGTTYKSSVSRSQQQELTLQQDGEQTYLLELQGMIFFGTAHVLLGQVRGRIVNQAARPLRFLVLDFRLVTGLDSSAVMSFVRLQQLAVQYSFQVVCTRLNAQIEQQLRRGGFLDGSVQVFPDLERGMEWCESQILASVWRRKRSLPLVLLLERIFDGEDQSTTFMQALESMDVDSGDIIFCADDPSGDLFLIESGQITLLLDLPDGRNARLHTLGEGTVLGQEAFYNQIPYQVTAKASQPSVVYRLSRENLKGLQQEHPAIAIAFQEFIITQLSNRITHANQMIKNLLE